MLPTWAAAWEPSLQRKSGKSINARARLPSQLPASARCSARRPGRSGREVTDIGVAPTPLLYFSAVHLEADGADHDYRQPQSPAEFNGFKTVCGFRHRCMEKPIQEVLHIIQKPAIS